MACIKSVFLANSRQACGEGDGPTENGRRKSPVGHGFSTAVTHVLLHRLGVRFPTTADT